MPLAQQSTPNLKADEAPIDSKRMHYWLSITILVYAFSALFLSFRIPPQYNWHDVINGIIATNLVGFTLSICAYVIYVMAFIRPKRLTHYIFFSSRAYMTRSRICHALPVIMLLPIFIAAFTYYKATIPLNNLYSWDTQLVRIDSFIHGGVHPWIWLQPIIGFPIISSILNFFYHLWFFVIFACVYWTALSMNMPVLRMRFLFSFVITWILLGNVVATAASSVGPCFFEFIDSSENPYKPLLQYLNQANQHFPIWALQVQKMLWTDYQNGSVALGISAMPSMHVASAVLVALFAKNINRTAGVAGLIFAIIIMIGSVHLGWHYAIDGYIGAIGAVLIWRLVGWLITRNYSGTVQAPYPACAPRREMQRMKA